jgi:4-amino-4-deoxy-L-arabinose transferase-like glycosyltransferase
LGSFKPIIEFLDGGLGRLAARFYDSAVRSPQPGSDAPSRPLPEWALAVGAAFAYFALRLPGLMDMPIFCDESIYLRYAQLIHRAPLSNAFVSLVDPKPPLHYWLLASFFGVASDPLLPARLLSVVAGAASLLLLFPLSRELSALRRGGAGDDGGTGVLAGSACLLFLTSPFLAFYQRMALAESLLLLETLLVAWLGLRWASHARTRTLASLAAKDALPLGIALGAALLTKQNYSYTLLALPVVAAMARSAGAADGSQRRRLFLSYLLALAVALLLFAPYLLASPGPGLRDRVFFRASHGGFGGLSLLARLTWDNVRYVFVPMEMKDVFPVRFEGFRAPADAGWLWIYLTPPVYLLGLAGFAALAARREARLLAFLAGWSLLMLLPFVPFATMSVSRYALPAAPPFLLAGALLLEIAGRRREASVNAPRRMTLVRFAALAALLLLPLRSLALQDADWQRQPMTRSDRWQYVSGWPAGLASRQAVDALRELARHRGPLVVILSALPGTPNDVVWVYLEGERNVSLFFVPWAFQSSILVEPPSAPGRFVLFSGFHDKVVHRRLVEFPHGATVLFVAVDPYPAEEGGTVTAGSVLAPRNPGLAEVARFSNPPMGLPHAPDSVVIYRLR